MDNFSIKTHISRKDYLQFLYSQSYNKPSVIFISLSGCYLVVTTCLQYLQIIQVYEDGPVTELICGIFMVLFPVVVVQSAAKKIYSSRTMQHPIQYSFSPEGVRVKGITCDSNYSWEHFIKYQETKKYLLLFSGKKSGHFIDKSNLTGEQLQFIKSNIRKAGQPVAGK